jgi:hypothetical protein
MDPDKAPDPVIFVLHLQDANFSANYFLKVQLHHLTKVKNQTKSQNIRSQSFSYNFCLMIE